MKFGQYLAEDKANYMELVRDSKAEASYEKIMDALENADIGAEDDSTGSGGGYTAIGFDETEKSKIYDILRKVGITVHDGVHLSLI